ncbi:hypothetical protein GT370_05875 [Acidocella sp. MX-AZ03]|uniref:Ppx/GppA phosphatase family protein n=1 Tax=Acidocella sp. MX-AZ03 TaxID=2697363 RepID=UPI0022DDB8DA|nr:hypothetical protein [Acidocella sp. MX-AZ03]WBO60335.1 hypothetical protein GT370_05875 [Acidocella sp. MX-AZ03]
MPYAGRHPTAQGFHILDSFSRVVRLGEGLYETGQLSELAMERAIASLSICAERVRRFAGDELNGPIRLRAIATEACRQAENGHEFVRRVRETTGLPLEIINPREEAELAVESCAPLLRRAGRRALLFDIGGGSTEIAWVRLDAGPHPELIGYLSLPVGWSRSPSVALAPVTRMRGFPGWPRISLRCCARSRRCIGLARKSGAAGW